MEIEWDAEKDVQNRAKHGVGLAEAALLEWENAVDETDERFDYGELRIKTLAPLNGRLMACIYTLREGRYRIISLRKANPREVGIHDRFR